MSLAQRTTDVMMPVRPMFAVTPQQAGAFEVEKHGTEGLRLVMREPHFANNVRYVLVVDRSRTGSLKAYWNDSEDERQCSWLEVGIA
jgi:hypothetical protein